MSEQRTSTSTPGTPTAPPQAPPIVTMANIRSSSALSQIPQVQVIPQPMHSPPYLSNFPYNPQIMLQNAAVGECQLSICLSFYFLVTPKRTSRLVDQGYGYTVLYPNMRQYIDLQTLHRDTCDSLHNKLCWCKTCE